MVVPRIGPSIPANYLDLKRIGVKIDRDRLTTHEDPRKMIAEPIVDTAKRMIGTSSRIMKSCAG